MTMKRATIATLAITIAGCPTKPDTPSSWNRTPANTPENVAYFKEQAESRALDRAYQSRLESEVNSLSAQVAELRRQLLIQQMTATAPAHHSAHKHVKRAKGGKGATKLSSTMSISHESTVFTFMHAPALMAFVVPERQRAAFLSTAAQSTKITIRAVATSGDQLQTKAALSRAMSAKNFLTEQGVDAKKISVLHVKQGSANDAGRMTIRMSGVGKNEMAHLAIDAASTAKE